jgi:hypothetical protein
MVIRFFGEENNSALCDLGVLVSGRTISVWGGIVGVSIVGNRSVWLSSLTKLALGGGAL